MAHASPRGQLTDLLVALFDDTSLRAFVEKLEGGPRLLASLPSPPVEPATLAFKTCGVLDRHGYIDAELFAALVLERPQRRAEIERVARAWGFALPPVASSTSPGTVLSPAASAAAASASAPAASAAVSPSRELWRITISGLLANLPDHKTLESTLRSLSDDCKLTIERVLEGSVIIEVDTTPEAGDLLKRLFEAGNLKELWGRRILRIEPNDVGSTRTPPAPVAPASVAPPADPAPETWDVFVSYAHADREPVERLAVNLHELGLRVFFDAWELGPGDVVQRRLEAGLRGSKAGVLVVSQTSVTRPWVMEEYAVMLEHAVTKDRRLIPVVIDDAALPSMLRTRLWIDLRGRTGDAYREQIEALVRAIRGQRPGPPPRTGRLRVP